MSFAASALASAVLAESAHVNTGAPAWVFAAIAAVIFAILGVVTFSYRDVFNRHSQKSSAHDAHGGHGH